MKDIVSFETAKRLRDAGFPQPEFATGQIWYNLYAAASFIGRKDCDNRGNTTFFCTSLRTGTTDEIRLIKDVAIFAATAADILRELGEAYSLTICGPFFRVEQMKADEYFVVAYWQDENPAEACAKAWLEKNKPVSS